MYRQIHLLKELRSCVVGVVGVEGKALTTEHSAQPEIPFATSVGKWVECQNVETAREL